MILENWIYLLALAAIFVIVRVIFLQSRIWYLRRMHKRWKSSVTKSTDAKYIEHEEIPQFQRALLEAKIGIENVKWTETRPTGYGFVEHGSIQLLKNICVPNEEITPISNAKIGEAIGAYRMRRNDTINPIHWAITLWNLPQSIAGSFGANKNALPVRVIQLLYQLAVVVGFLVKIWNFWHKVFP